METHDTSENLQARLFAAEQRLLAEGIPSYFDVMMALQELHQNIHKRCRQVLQEGIEEFAGAIDMRLNAEMIEDYSYPDSISKLAMDDEAWLGVKIRLHRPPRSYRDIQRHPLGPDGGMVSSVATRRRTRGGERPGGQSSIRASAYCHLPNSPKGRRSR